MSAIFLRSTEHKKRRCRQYSTTIDLEKANPVYYLFLNLTGEKLAEHGEGEESG